MAGFVIFQHYLIEFCITYGVLREGRYLQLKVLEAANSFAHSRDGIQNLFAYVSYTSISLYSIVAQDIYKNISKVKARYRLAYVAFVVVINALEYNGIVNECVYV